MGTDIEAAARALIAGELVGIPTETVYGLAADATNVTAVARVFEAKARPQFDPLIVHVPSLHVARSLVTDISPALERLAHACWPGPLTLLLPRAPCIADLVTAGLPRVAVRVPLHPLVQQLLVRIDRPLVAPSANRFGHVSPTRAEHVHTEFGESLAYVLDGGPCSVGIESTIVGEENGVLTIFRQGGLAREDIEAIARAPVEVRLHSSSRPQAPGMLERHYAPRTTLVRGNIAALLRTYADKRVGVLSFRTIYAPHVPHRMLSSNGDLREAAANLFAALRELDAMDLDVIVTEPLPSHGLGPAINDRLLRASAREVGG